jgi:MscS family membrane protein
MIWGVGGSFLAKFIIQQKALLKMFDIFCLVGIVFAVALFGLTLVQALHDSIIDSQQKKGDPIDFTTANAIGRLIKISIIIIAFLSLLRIFGVGLTGVLAFGGIGGIAVGFAAKDILANFFGGLGVFLDRSFAVGDWIRSPDKDIEGIVEHIGWRITRIRTFENRPLYVPNAIFTTISLENPSRMSHRRIQETIGLCYDDADKLMSIVTDIRKMLNEHSDIDQEKGVTAHFTGLTPSSLNILINVHTTKTAGVVFNDVKEDVLLKIHHIIRSHNARIAFPTSTVYLPDFAHGRKRKLPQSDHDDGEPMAAKLLKR